MSALTESVHCAIATRLRRGQTPDQLVSVGRRTGWWTADDVDWAFAGGDGPRPKDWTVDTAAAETPTEEAVSEASPTGTAGTTPAEIRDQVDAMAPRTHEDGSINAQHVAIEQTLRERHGHPGYIAELDGPGKFRPGGAPPPTPQAPARDLLAEGLQHIDRRVRSAATRAADAVDELVRVWTRAQRSNRSSADPGGPPARPATKPKTPPAPGPEPP